MTRMVMIFLVITFAYLYSAAQSPDPVYFDRTEYGVGDAPAYVHIADLDGDGDEDIVSANKLTHDVSVLLNSGDGTFLADSSYGAGGNPVSVCSADLNGDSLNDLAFLYQTRGEFEKALRT